jgi:hypothetical protein
MRWLALASLMMMLAACKKPEQDEPAPPPTDPPKVGHGTIKTSGSAHADGDPGDAGVVVDAHLPGGNGAPAFRDDQGRVHGPGGPVFMGSGTECNPSRDHCMRDGVWFAVRNVMPGKLFRAVPVFAFEDKWYTWRGEPAEAEGKIYKTQMAGTTAIPEGTSVIFFSSETSDTKWADSEYEALTSSRWEAAVTEQAASGHGTVRIKGFGDTSQDSVRLIVDTKSF